MTQNDYSRPARAPFPRALAARIALKASIMAGRFEDQAIRSMVRDAQRALDRGVREDVIATEMALPSAENRKARGNQSGPEE
ncbi:hypothetical protein A7D21_18450 [Pseudomonas sp. AP19]|nr:hypothetical protein A7D21_18450 [Pseudomonas sp. AP19]